MDERRLAKTVFENVNDAVVVLGTNRHIRAINFPFTQMTGYRPDEAIGKSLRLLWSGRHTEEFFNEIERHLVTAGHWRGEVWERRKNGEIFPVWENISAVRDDNGVLECYVLVLTDIGAFKETEQRLEYLAHHDLLTGLSNRLHFQANLAQALTHAARYGRCVAVLYVDLDRFKQINDTLGHAAGDKVIKAVGERLRSCVRAEDAIARLGGDEFVVALEQHEREEAAALAEKIIQAVRQPMDIDGHAVTLSSSVGISIYPDDGHDGTALIETADIAMYHAKQQGKNMFQYFVPGFATIARKDSEPKPSPLDRR